jgi:hypothetical protein
MEPLLVSPAIAIFLGGGVLSLVMGVLGLQGRLARLPADTALHNYSAQALCGGALIGMGVVLLLERHPAIAGVLTLPTVVLLVLGLYASFIRPPRWSQPTWQRDMDDQERRSRR